MSYPEVPFKARVVQGAAPDLPAGGMAEVTGILNSFGEDHFVVKGFGWRASRFEVIQEPEETEGLAYYRKLFPSGTKVKVVCRNDKGLWAKFGGEYTVQDVIEISRGTIAIRPQEYFSTAFDFVWIDAERCEPVCEETHNIETSDEPQFKVACNQTYTLTIKGVTFELTSDEFTELERAMEDF